MRTAFSYVGRTVTAALSAPTASTVFASTSFVPQLPAPAASTSAGADVSLIFRLSSFAVVFVVKSA